MTVDRPNPNFEAEQPRPDLQVATPVDKPKGRMRKVFLFLSVVLLIIGGAAAWDAYRFLHIPPEQPG